MTTTPDLLEKLRRVGPNALRAMLPIRDTQLNLAKDAKRVIAIQEGVDGRGTLLWVLLETRRNAIAASLLPATGMFYVREDFTVVSQALAGMCNFNEVAPTSDGRRTLHNASVSSANLG